MKKYDVIVIGGGLLGCFAARAMTRYKLKTALLEAREDVCTGISRANTAIIYSGYDTKPGTLKSRMCVKAAQTFGELCKELGVRYSPCGSLMVCFGPRGEESLRKKMARGLESGVRGMRLLTKEEVLALEPNISSDVHMGLWAPESGTVIPWELGLAAAENAAANGADFIFNTKVTGIEKTELGYKVDANGRMFFSRGIVNCAGLSADGILEMVQSPSVRIFPTAGDYFVLDTKAGGHIGHVIFHEPEEKGKGLTLVPTADGNILIGPTETDVSGDNDYRTTREGLDRLTFLVDEVIPSMPMEHVIRNFGALRPNPFHVHRDPDSGAVIREDKSISNFIIHESAQNPAFLSLVGIKTPGLTCANELGIHVARQMASLLGEELNPAYSPKAPVSIRVEELTLAERRELIHKNPAYSRIVCRCRNVTEGEIVDSIERKPGAVTVDGVKRRTGACTGRCQGGFCTQRIIEILSRELGIPPEEVKKDGPGSNVFGGGK